LAKPIKKDDREHIEYVPTQVVTEFLRHEFRTEGGHRVKGIIYQSARNGKGKCCVLFVRNAISAATRRPGGRLTRRTGWRWWEPRHATTTREPSGSRNGERLRCGGHHRLGTSRRPIMPPMIALVYDGKSTPVRVRRPGERTEREMVSPADEKIVT